MSASVIFCGTPAFAVPSLEALAADPAFDVSLVITQPDRPVGRSKELIASPVKQAAQRLHLPVAQPENINHMLADTQYPIPNPQFLIVVAYGQILSQHILDLPQIAPVNVHGSLLPRWRGASPVEHAILAGDTETGVTIQIMETTLDTGPILAMRKTPIGPRDTTLQLKERLCVIGADLLVQTLKAPLRPIPQPTEGITVCRKLSREDGRAEPQTMTAQQIDRMVRALVPWPGVTCFINGQALKLIATALEPTDTSIPLPCAQGTTLHLVTVQEAGKRAMTGQEWERGQR